MRVQTFFDPEVALILVRAEIWGPRGRRVAKLALDTGATDTLIIPEVIDEIGYSARDGIERTSVTSAIGREYGYLLPIQRFESLGFSFDHYAVNVFDLPEAAGIDGLLGLSFFRELSLEIRLKEACLWAERLL